MEPLIKTNLLESLAKIIIDQIKNGVFVPGSCLATEKDLIIK